MSREVDELFGSGEGAPTPRTSVALALLGAGLVLAVLGMLCSAIPGSLVVLLAWVVIEKERDRVDSGYLPAQARGSVEAVRTIATAGVMTVILLCLAQSVLTCTNFYDVLWTGMIGWWLGVPT